MNYQFKQGKGIIILEKDEDLFLSIEEIAKKENLKCGFFNGIGALKKAELGFYHLHKKEYHREFFNDEVELLSMNGNLSLLNEKPFLHIHATLGSDDFSCFGGHLFKAVVAVTCEIRFEIYPFELTRTFNECIGLNLLNLKI